MGKGTFLLLFLVTSRWVSLWSFPESLSLTFIPHKWPSPLLDKVAMVHNLLALALPRVVLVPLILLPFTVASLDPFPQPRSQHSSPRSYPTSSPHRIWLKVLLVCSKPTIPPPLCCWWLDSLTIPNTLNHIAKSLLLVLVYISITNFSLYPLTPRKSNLEFVIYTFVITKPLCSRLFITFTVFFPIMN